MTMCRRFNGRPVVRIIVSVPAEEVATLDLLLQRMPARERMSRSEFVRVAVAEKLGRELMIHGGRVAEGAAARPDDFSAPGPRKSAC